jgi:hypothetical protein
MSGLTGLYFGSTLLSLVRQWLDAIEINNLNVARCLCQIIPERCPLERNIALFGHTIFHIPPLCQLNPLYEQIVGLRFRSLCYLVESGEDVTRYC